MLKKALFFVLAVVVLQSVCFSAEHTWHLYPQYLHNDENYIYCDGHMGTAWYVDRSSISVEEETDDECILSVTVVAATYNDHQTKEPFGVDDIRKEETKQYTFLYDLDEQDIYYASGLKRNHFSFIERHGRKWRYIDPDGCWADVGIIKPVAIEIYKEQYNHDFYITD